MIRTETDATQTYTNCQLIMLLSILLTFSVLVSGISNCKYQKLRYYIICLIYSQCVDSARFDLQKVFLSLKCTVVHLSRYHINILQEEIRIGNEEWFILILYRYFYFDN